MEKKLLNSANASVASPLKSLTLRCIGAMFACGALQPAALAAPPDAGSLLRQQENKQGRLPDRMPEPEAPSAKPAMKAEKGLRVLVKSISFSGATGLASEAELNVVVADAIGKELDYAGLEQLAQRVTDLLRSKGWFLAEAYLPRQDVTEGNIEIAIRAGRLDGKNGKGRPYVILPGGKPEPRIAAKRLDDIAAGQLRAGEAAKERDLERAVLLMGDLPGVSARARLEPGEDEGSTRVMVDVEEGPLFTASVGLDNYGSPDTGIQQLNASLQVNDPTGIGDQGGILASGGNGLEFGRLYYGLPIGSNGTRMGAFMTSMNYRVISAVGLAAGLKGSSATAGATLSHPFVRSRADNVNGTLGYERKSFTDNSAFGVLRDKRADVWTAAFSGNKLDTFSGGGLTLWNAGWTGGKLDLSRAPNDLLADAAGYNTQGSYDKFNYGLARLQKLPGAFAVFANFSGQTAGKNLDSSEKFILGGPNGVRAYPGAEASGDSGWMANLELRYDLPGGTALGPLQFLGFYDAGYINLHRDQKNIPIPTATGQNGYGLAGWGFGMNLTKTGSHALRLAWAHKAGSNPGRTVTGLDADGRASNSRVWLQGTLWF